MSEQPNTVNLSINVNKAGFEDLFSIYKAIIIPDYQREYVWNSQNFESLVEDFLEYHNDTNPKPGEFYMGSIVFYNKSDTEVEVVDGQQRLTTLLIFDYVLNGDKSILELAKSQLSFDFESKVSKENIKICQKFIRHVKPEDQDCIRKVLAKIIFIVLETNSPDQAFTLFDTQNSRGIKPGVVDLLKPLHLRQIKDDELLQEQSAKKWELIEKFEKKSGKEIIPWSKTFFMNDFVCKVLWRSRTWKYEYTFETEEKVKKEFYKKLGKSIDNKIMIFPTKKYMFINAINCQGNGDHFETKSFSIIQSVKDYPFSVRQPLQKGIGFFKYIEKYFEILNYIFDKEQGFKQFFEKIYRWQSTYMKEAFVCATLLYVDRFGYDKLLQFACYWDYATGHLRQSSYRIRQDKYPTYITNQHLFSKITHAYTEEELFKELLIEPRIEINSISNPMRNYNKNCLEYYGINYSDFSQDYEKEKEYLIKSYWDKRKELISKFYGN